MARHIKRRPTVGQQTSFEDFMAPDTKPRKPRVKTKDEFMTLLVVTNELREKQDWKAFTPKHFVALYCLLHKHVYGVIPDEVRTQFNLAVRKAHTMLRSEFDGDQGRMVAFMRWVWAREMKRNKTRTADDDFRIGWRLQFASNYLSDYRVSRARRGKRVQ